MTFSLKKALAVLRTLTAGENGLACIVFFYYTTKKDSFQRYPFIKQRQLCSIFDDGKKRNPKIKKGGEGFLEDGITGNECKDEKSVLSMCAYSNNNGR